MAEGVSKEIKAKSIAISAETAKVAEVEAELVPVEKEVTEEVEVVEAEVEREEYVYDQGVPMVLSPPGMGVIESIVSDIKYRAQLIARNQKLESGVSATSIIGFAIGFAFAILMIMLPILIGGI